MWTIAAGLVLVVVGQTLFAQREFVSIGLGVWLAGLGMAVALHHDDEWCNRHPRVVTRVLRPPSPRNTWTSCRTVIPGIASLLAAIAVWTGQRSRAFDEQHDDIVVLWLISMLAAVIAVWHPERRPVHEALDGLRSWWARHRVDVVATVGVGVSAMVVTLVRLDSYPRTFNGDEANFAIISRRVVDGGIPNPFGVGFLSHPLLYNVLQGTTMRFVGDNVTGARAATAVAGAAAVSLSYLLVRRLTDRRSIALIAAVFLGTSYAHIYWSRSALPNGWTIGWVLLVLYLLDRALEARRPAGLLVAGLATGLAQYFYLANRVLVPVVLGIVVVTAVAEHRRTRRLLDVVRLNLVRVAIVAVGFVLAVLPQLAYYSKRPYDFDSRAASVSIFSSGWLRQEAERTGRNPVGVLWHQFVDASMVPFRSVVSGQLRGGPPYVGWPIALMGAVGLALVTVRIGRGRLWTALALAYWLSALGVAATVEASSSHRSVVAVMLVCILAAVGLDFTARAANEWRRTRGDVVRATAVVIVIVTGSWNAYRFFRSPDQVEVYSDANTEVVEHLARSLSVRDRPVGVYFAGSPRVRFDGFRNFEFRSPGVTGIDIDEPLTDTDLPPGIDGPTLFVFLPERLDELAVVRRWFPEGVRRTHADAHGATLYDSYLVRGTD